MKGGPVIVLDDDADLLATIADLFELAHGRKTIGVGSLSELVEMGDRIADCDLAILDINLGPGVPSGIDAYAWLRRRQFAGRIVFLTGHARTHPLVEQAYQLGDVRVLQKPITLQQLGALLDV